MLIKNGIKAKRLSFKNNTKIFSALNRHKEKNIRPGPKKQHSYKKKEFTLKNRLLTSVRVVLPQYVYVSRSVKT